MRRNQKGDGGLGRRRYSERIGGEVEDLKETIYIIDKNKETCNKTENDEMFGSCDISPRVAERGEEEGEPCGPHDLMEFHRGEVEVRGPNAGTTRRKAYVDIGAVKGGRKYRER